MNNSKLKAAVTREGWWVRRAYEWDGEMDINQQVVKIPDTEVYVTAEEWEDNLNKEWDEGSFFEKYREDMEASRKDRWMDNYDLPEIGYNVKYGDRFYEIYPDDSDSEVIDVPQVEPWNEEESRIWEAWAAVIAGNAIIQREPGGKTVVVDDDKPHTPKVVYTSPSGKQYDENGNIVEPFPTAKGSKSGGVCGHGLCTCTPAEIWVEAKQVFMCKGCADDWNRMWGNTSSRW